MTVWRKLRRQLRPFTRWFGFSFVALATVGCGALTATLGYLAFVRREPKMLILVVGIFGGMAAVLGWIAYRECTRLKQPPVPIAELGFPMAAIMEQLHYELFAQSDISLRLATDGPLQRIESAMLSYDLDEAERLLNEQLQKSPKDLFLQIKRWEILLATERLREAAEHLSFIRSSFQLGASARTFLLLEELTTRAKGGDNDKVREGCEEFLRGSASVTEKTLVLDGLACLPILEGLRTYLDEADHWSIKALELSPNDLTLKGTRGSLLVEKSQLDEGEILLREVFENSESDFDYGICAFYLGLIAKRRGNEREAIRLGRIARRILPEPWPLSRASNEIGIN